jgi:hypothetical protein
MELEKVLMTEEIAALKTNPAYVELIARKQLGLVRTGEVVFYCLNPLRAFLKKQIPAEKLFQSQNSRPSSFSMA